MKKALIFSILFFLAAAALAVQTKEKNLLVGKIETIQVDQVQKFVNTNPKVLLVEKKSHNEVNLYGRYPGEAYVHIWDYDNNLTTYRIAVLGKKAPLQRGYKTGKVTGQYSTYFKADNTAQYHPNRALQTHKIEMQFPTAWGRNYTNIRYKAQQQATENMRSSIDIFQTRFAGRGYDIVLGDDVISYSELMAPGLTYQGAHMRLRSFFSNIHLDAFSGKRGTALWGSDVRDDTGPTYNVSGGKLVWDCTPTVSFQSTFLSTHENSETIAEDEQKLSVYSLGTTYVADSYLTFFGEAAQSQRGERNKDATRLQGVWDNTALRIDCIIRDISPEYETVSTWLDYQGQKGIYVRTKYRPTPYWSLWGAFDGYMKRFTNDLSNKDYNLNRNRVSFAFHKLQFVAPSISVWRNFGSGFQWEGASLRLSHINFLAPLFTFYYEFSPSNYFNDIVQAASYRQQRGIFGISYKPITKIDVRLERQWEEYDFYSGKTNDPHGENIIVNWGYFLLFNTTIKTDLSLRYQNRKNSKDTIDQKLYSGSVHLRDAITANLSWYMRLIGVRQNIKHYDYTEAEYVYTDDNIRSEISGGVTYLF